MKFKPNSRKGGFSLVELIVVIAIMAVLVAVLAPSLLQYVERSRAQKDASAMGEVTNATMLGLSDQDMFDEVVFYSRENNVSCYIDQDDETGLTRILTNPESSAEYYTFGDETRKADETPYFAAGMYPRRKSLPWTGGKPLRLIILVSHSHRPSIFPGAIL